jgi:branched-subunit amino acid ABC-type transport system permease component
MKTISHPLFLVLAGLYMTYYTLKHSGVALPELITNYFADLTSLFLINTIALFALRKLFRRPELELSLGMIGISFVLISLFFEVIFPRQENYYIADWNDVLCYFISATVYFLWRKSPKGAGIEK